MEALKAPPFLGPLSLMVESWPKPVCFSTGDRVAVDAKVEPSLLCLTMLIAAREKGRYIYLHRKHRYPEQSVFEEDSCSAAEGVGLAACRQDCTARRLSM